MDVNKKIVLIDGHSILNRAFYGVPDLTNAQGIHTNAVYGFLNIMFKIIDEEKPTNIAVAFDLKNPTFRHEMFSEYKGTRKPMPAELHEQVPLIKEVLSAMNITTMELPGFEADDILGTMAKRAENEGYSVSVITGDRDLLQLATDKILIRIPKTKKGTTEIENYYASDVLERYQVTPVEFITLKALVGDTADNIPGVPSVGEKTATPLVVKYKNLDVLYENIDDITRKKLKENLLEYKEQAYLSLKLATIDTEAPVVVKINDTILNDMFNDKAFEMMKKLEFKSILNKFDVGNQKSELVFDYKVIDDFSEVQAIFAECNKAEFVSISAFADKDSGIINKKKKSENEFVKKSKTSYDIVAVGLTLDGKNIRIIPKQWFVTDDFLAEEIMKLLVNKNCLVVLDELKRHLKLLDRDDFFSDSIFDLSLAAYLMNPLKDTYDYDDLARDFLDTSVLSRNEIIPKMTYREAFESVMDKFCQCAALNVGVNYMAYDKLKAGLEETEQLDLYNNIELPLVFSLNRMENIGIMVKKSELSGYSEMLSEKIDIIEKKIFADTGMEFNINSPKQLGEVLFEKMQIPGGKKTKTGYSTAADVLEKLAMEHPVVKEILEYRQLTKLKSTYADGLRNYIEEDNRIRGTFNQTITATGRISSTEPNLQNIPIRMEIGRELRKVFVPKEGCRFIDADYSQIELRVLASMSCDEALISAYKMAEDIHRLTASKVFNIPFDEVTDEQRRNAKAVNFGIVYGISSFGLSQDLSITKKEAGKYIEEYFKTYPKIKEFLDDSVNTAKNQGYVTTLFGRRRPIPEISSSNFMQRSFGERIAMNSPIQGTAADIMKIAMLEVDRALMENDFKSRIVLQVHDELLIEAYEEEIEEVKCVLREKMQNAAKLAVELEVGMGIGDSWLDAH